MTLPKKDLVATALVAVAGLIYLLWAIDSALPGLGSARASGAVVLLLGFAASASAVVPAFAELLRGSKAYLAITSLIGVVALIAGVVVLTSASGAAFTTLILAMVVLWAIATTHHTLLAQPDLVQPRREVPARLHK